MSSLTAPGRKPFLIGPRKSFTGNGFNRQRLLDAKDG
jgi:hypothetical protein